jgi:hypothetical protein
VHFNVPDNAIVNGFPRYFSPVPAGGVRPDRAEPAGGLLLHKGTLHLRPNREGRDEFQEVRRVSRSGHAAQWRRGLLASFQDG